MGVIGLSVTLQAEQTSRLDLGAVADDVESVLEEFEAGHSLLLQNSELRHRLEEEHNAYRKRMQAYQEGQQRQAQLIQKLQSKVINQ